MPGIISVRQAYTVPMQVPHSFASLVIACGLRPTFAYGFALASGSIATNSHMHFFASKKKVEVSKSPQHYFTA